MSENMPNFNDLTDLQKFFVHRFFEFKDCDNKTRKLLLPLDITTGLIFPAAESSDHILIHGPTGCGKDALAQFLAAQAREKTNQKVFSINCARFSPQLVAGELFGYVEGAFTGAKKKGHKGIIESAHPNILVLEEIGTMPEEHQASLLQYIQDGTIIPVGGNVNDQIKLATRIIATTNVDIKDRQIFRQDLQHRFVWQFGLRPLNHRRYDILLLFDILLSNCDNKRRWNVPVGLLLPLICHDWSGNIRELQAYCKRMAQSVSLFDSIQDNLQKLGISDPDGKTEYHFYLLGNLEDKWWERGQAYAKAILRKYEPVRKQLPKYLKNDPCFAFGMLILAESAGIRTNNGVGSFISLDAIFDGTERCSFHPSDKLLKSVKSPPFPKVSALGTMPLFGFLHELYFPTTASMNTEEDFTNFIAGKASHDPPNGSADITFSDELKGILSKLTLPDVSYNNELFIRILNNPLPIIAPVVTPPVAPKRGRPFGRGITDEELLAIIKDARGTRWEDAVRRFHSSTHPTKLLYSTPKALRKRISRIQASNKDLKRLAYQYLDEIIGVP